MAVILMLVALLALPFLLIALLIFAARHEARRHSWEFRISDIVSLAFTTLGRARTPILLTGLVLALPSLALQLVLGVDLSRSMFQMESEQLVALIGFGGLLGLVFGTLGEVIMTALALDALAGRPADFRVAFAKGLRLLLPAVLIRILWWLGVIFGTMLLFIPGLILMLTWLIVLPVLVAEGTGVFASFGRSGALVRGARWRLLLLVAIVAVAFSMVSGMGQGFMLASATEAARITGAVIQSLLTMVSSALTVTGLSAVYHQLKSQREGLVGEDLEAVFA
ncbi:hypothetical protein LK533_14375 [Sphingomonas sp. PL-96]|uniref:hypothetical protein n=1 Tax=Sphingomonas sp. PL-96 TaxID=2887201 RepID=UPI001E4646BA|nr:hypothetical protein [Sphingomonas sp. PL-96]MCC2977857.1 hypothetical protein [Sphingomonas sp. PL-96]